MGLKHCITGQDVRSGRVAQDDNRIRSFVKPFDPSAAFILDTLHSLYGSMHDVLFGASDLLLNQSVSLALRHG